MIAISQVFLSIFYTSYFASVAAAGSEPAVARDTMSIRRPDMSVIGTTGRNPSTVVPAAMRAMTSTPPTAQTVTDVPGGGAGTVDWMTATPAIAAAVQSATASAPHLVLFFQNSAAISSGDSAE